MIIFLRDWSALSNGPCMQEKDLWAESLCTSQRDKADTYIPKKKAFHGWWSKLHLYLNSVPSTTNCPAPQFSLPSALTCELWPHNIYLES